MNTAVLMSHADEPVEPAAPAPALAPALTPEAEPKIEPQMALLLEFTQKNQSSVTPKEINATLASVLKNYDELTARYAENSEKIDAELENIRQNGSAVSEQLQQLHADLQQQRQAFAALEASTSQSVQTLQNDLEIRLNENNTQWQGQLTALHSTLDSNIGALDARLTALNGLLETQERIIREQSTRLDQFNAAQELLDTATRGNRSRIEVVREQAENQHAVLQTQIAGLRALQNERYAEFQKVQTLVDELHALQQSHYAELQKLRGMVDGLQIETQRLDQNIQQVSTELATTTTQTHTRFKRTHGAILAVLALSLAGFALVKWAPAFAPTSTNQSVAQLDQRVDIVGAQVDTQINELTALKQTAMAQEAKLAAQQTKLSAQETKISALSDQVVQLENSYNDLGKSVQTLRAATLAAATGDTSSFPLHDSRWLLAQNPKAYTVQLLSADDPAEMTKFIASSEGQFAEIGLAYSVTQREARERYNLFYGIFDDAAQARAAIDELPAYLRVNKPWVRRVQSVHDALR